METYLKCLLRCVPRVRVCEEHLKPIVKLNAISHNLSSLYSKFFLHCVKTIEAEQKDMYSQARLFIAYDRALEGGRDQDWWFEQCNEMMDETIEYWQGRTPSRVQYELSKDDPQRFPLAYVYWQNRIAWLRASSFVRDNKYWLLGCLVLGVL